MASKYKCSSGDNKWRNPTYFHLVTLLSSVILYIIASQSVTIYQLPILLCIREYILSRCIPRILSELEHCFEANQITDRQDC